MGGENGNCHTDNKMVNAISAECTALHFMSLVCF